MITVVSLTKPAMEILNVISPSGEVKVIPEEIKSWHLKSVEEMKHHMLGLLLDPCPVP